jgi:tetratricopeptide (TPR) repeat protein
MWKLALLFCLLGAASLPAQKHDWRAFETRFNQLCQQGDFVAARMLITTALDDVDPDQDLRGAGTLLWLLGVANHVLGDFDEADLRFRAAISALERAGGPAALSLARARIGHAALLELRGCLDQAERLREDGIRVLRRELSPNHPEILHARSQLAASLLRRGDLDGAEQLCREVIAASNDSAGFPNGFLAESYFTLGSVLLAGGQNASAADALAKSLALTESDYGPDHPTQINGSVALATAHLRLRQFDSAATLLDRAERIALAFLGPQHPLRLEVLTARCELLRAEGKKSEARKLEKTVHRLEKAARERGHTVSWAEWTAADHQ